MQLLITLAVLTVLGTTVLVSVAAHQASQLHGAHESAMTVAMTFGMVVGLTAGIVAGLLIPDDLWPPTVVGTLAGVAAGVVSGRPAGLMAMLEGAMSGVMAGTMGAMLGGMMPSRGAPLIVSTLILTVGAGAASLMLLMPKGHPGHHPGPGLLPRNGLIAAGLIVLVGGPGTWFAAGPLVHRLPLPEEHRHVAPVEVTVKAAEFGFSPAVVEVPLGRPVRLRLVNEGQQEHDLTIPGLEYRLSARSDRRAEPPGLHLYTPAGDTATLDIVPLRAGDFPAHCSVAGHKDQGMVLTIRVTQP